VCATKQYRYLSAGIIRDVEGVRHLAELGVVFLLFNIGLELSLERLQSMQKFVFGLGAGQVPSNPSLHVEPYPDFDPDIKFGRNFRCEPLAVWGSARALRAGKAVAAPTGNCAACGIQLRSSSA